MSNLDSHRSRYKNTALDARELRRRRDEEGVQLRKQKREEALCKRRTLANYINSANDINNDDMIGDFHQDQASALTTPTTSTGSTILHQVQQQCNEQQTNISDTISDDDQLISNQGPFITPQLIAALNQNDNLQLTIEAAQRIRKMLSSEPNPPIDEVIASGLLPRLTELLNRDDSQTLQFDVAWAITNIASGTTEQTRAVFDVGAVEPFVRLLSSPSVNVCEQAVWALGNMIGDGPEMRDAVLSHGILQPLLALVRPDFGTSFLRNVCWVIVNLCRNKNPPPDKEVTRQLIPALDFLIQQEDLSILLDTTWALSYVTESGADQAQMVIDSGLVGKLVPLLTHNDYKIQAAAVRAVGSILTGTDEQTQVAIDLGALTHIRKLLTESKDKIAKEALWFLSNITAGDMHQIQSVIDEGLIPLVMHHLDKGSFSVQREAAWTIYNMVVSGTREQIDVLIQNDVIDPLCRLLSTDDTQVLHVVLDSICNMLKSYDTDFRLIAEKVEICGGLDRIEQLQQHANGDIYRLAYSIIDEYFSDDIGEDTNLKPKMNENEFEFSSMGPNDSGDDGSASYPRFDL